MPPAVEALVAALDTAAAATADADADAVAGRLVNGKVGVRLQASPLTLLPPLLAALNARWSASEAGAADSRWQLSPQDCGLVASVVVLSDGAWRTGISGVEAYAGDSQRSEEGYFVSDNNDDGEGQEQGQGQGQSGKASSGASSAVCRAQFKLSEAVLRAGVVKRGFGLHGCGVAIDAGSAPGGWTSYLATECAVKRVYSVDPAELDPVVLALPAVRALEHKHSRHHLP